MCFCTWCDARDGSEPVGWDRPPLTPSPRRPRCPRAAQVSFNNPFEMDDINHELQFCRWYPQLCKVDIWLLVGNIVPPSVVPTALRKVRGLAHPHSTAHTRACGCAVPEVARLTACAPAGLGRELRVGG